jgi:hypothetical protein
LRRPARIAAMALRQCSSSLGRPMGSIRLMGYSGYRRPIYQDLRGEKRPRFGRNNALEDQRRSSHRRGDFPAIRDFIRDFLKIMRVAACFEGYRSAIATQHQRVAINSLFCRKQRDFCCRTGKFAR